MRKVQNLTAIILILLSVCTSVVTAQQVIDELTVDFDGSPIEVVTLGGMNDIDNDGFFGIRNGAFEITDVEGTPCNGTSINGFNDNQAFVVGGVAQRNYCNVSITIETSISPGDFEECAAPTTITPIGCTEFSPTSEPGGDGILIGVSIGNNQLMGGYCGSNPTGSFTLTGIDISIGEFVQVNITGGTQAPDESYFVERVLVEETERSVVPSQITGQVDHCEGLGAIVLNVLPPGGSDHRWSLDGVPLNNDNNETYVSATPALTEEGLYQVEFIEPGGCPASAELKINVTDCANVAANFSIPNTFCSNESLSLPTNSISGLTGEWNVDPNLELDDHVGH